MIGASCSVFVRQPFQEETDEWQVLEGSRRCLSRIEVHGCSPRSRLGLGCNKGALWSFGLHRLHVPGVRWHRAWRRRGTKKSRICHEGCGLSGEL